MPDILRINNLKKSYKDYSLELSIALQPGSILGFVGENGAGKTTTIKSILNIVKPDSGEVILFNRKPGKDIEELRNRVGVVFDEPALPDCCNAIQISKIMDGIFNEWDPEEFMRLLKFLAVPKNKQIKDFSRGMKMKIAIAIAMSHNADLLLLDEPTSGLDPIVRDEVCDLFIDFVKDGKKSIFLSSHIVSDIEKTCDQIAFLHKGRMILHDDMNSLRNKYGTVMPEYDNCVVPEEAIAGRKKSPYGLVLLVLRDKLPPDIRCRPVNVEDLFLILAKEG